MGIRFNKRIKIAPGIKVNVGLGGVSTTFGGRGASINVGKRGVKGSASIPGTGISYSKILSSSRTQTRALKEEQRRKRESERIQRLSKVTLELNEENGTVTIFDSDGEELKGRDKTFIFDSQSGIIQGWLQDEVDKINGDIELLQDIFLDSPNIDIHPEYQIQEYDVPKPVKLAKEVPPAEPVKEHIPNLGFFARLFQNKRDMHALRLTDAENNHKLDLSKWSLLCKSIDFEYDKYLSKFKDEVSDWKVAKELHEQAEVFRKDSFRLELLSNNELMDEILASTIELMEWPRETIVDFQITNDGHAIWLDVDLPEIEDLPQKVATIAANGKKLNIKNKVKKQLQLEYAQHIHGIGLRLACFALSSLPKAQMVVISGYSQRLNSGTGKLNEDYLYSTKFTRDGLRELNFDKLKNVDPVKSHDLFEVKRKMTATGIFKAIEPFNLRI